MAITGLSMAAHARPVSDATEIAEVPALLRKRYPEYAGFPIRPEEIRVFRVLPKVISVLDYSKDFGHSELTVI